MFRSKGKMRSLLIGCLPAFFLAACGSPEQNAQTYYERGMEQIAKHDDVAARGELLKAIKYKTDRADIWRALVGVDERTKAAPAAVFGNLRRVVELDPNDLDARLKLARIMLNGGAADAALGIVEAAPAEAGSSAPLHALKALLLARTKDLAGAEREAKQAVEIDPSNVDATVLLSTIKVAGGDSDGALKLLNALPRQGNAGISLAKAQAYARKGNLSEAESQLQEAIKENPNDAGPRAQLIQLYIAAHRYDDAERELRGVADATPTNGRAGMDLVRFLLTSKGAKAARSELEARIGTGGDVFDYRLVLAELTFAEGDLPQAAQQLKALADTANTPERKLLAQGKLAEMYLSKGDVASAEPLITGILQSDHRNTLALRLRAAIAIQKRQFDSAIADLREALNDQPKSSELLVLMAVAYERSGKPELAERQYADALKASGQNSAVALQYVNFLRRQGDLAHAEDILIRVLTQSPRDIPLLTALAQIRAARQNWVGTLAVADAIRQIDGNRALADQVKATALAGQNKIEESLSALEDAHAAAPDTMQPVGLLVSAYLRAGKTDKAEALLQQMLKKFPDNAELLVWLGQTKVAQNKPDDASTDFKSAIAKQPKNAGAYAALSDLYARRKDFDGAAQVIEAALKEQPDDTGLRLKAAALQIQKGDSNAAIAQYEALLTDQPESPLVINNLASLILDNRTDKVSLDRAIALASKLKGANLPQFQETYGWAQFKKGDSKAAIAALEPVVAKVPDSAIIRYHLGMSYAADGQADKAAEQFKAALALEPDATPLKDKILAAMK